MHSRTSAQVRRPASISLDSDSASSQRPRENSSRQQRIGAAEAEDDALPSFGAGPAWMRSPANNTRGFTDHDEPLPGGVPQDASVSEDEAPTRPAPVGGTSRMPRPGTCDTQAEPVTTERRTIQVPEPQRAVLARLVNAIRADLAAWDGFTRSFEGEIPGARSIAVGREVDSVVGGPNDEYGVAARRWMRQELSSEELFHATQMYSFRQGAYLNAAAVWCDLHPINLVHRYKVTMQSAGGGYTGRGGLTGQANLSTLHIEYHNDVGMRWERSSGAFHGQVGTNITVELRPGRSGLSSGWGGGAEATDNDGEEVSTTFWAPSDFTGFMIGCASAGVGVQTPLGSGSHGPGALFVRFLSFSKGTLGFNLSSSENRNVATGGDPAITVGGSLTAGFGAAVPVGDSTTVDTAPRITCTDGSVAGETQTELLHTSVWFDTGSPTPQEDSARCLDAAVAEARRYLASSPGARLQVRIVAHASPRWAGAQNEAERVARNDELSSGRMSAVQGRIFQDLAEDAMRCESSRSCLTDWNSQAQGASQAGAYGAGTQDDNPLWRRVDVSFLRQAMHEVHTPGACS